MRSWSLSSACGVGGFYVFDKLPPGHARSAEVPAIETDRSVRINQRRAFRAAVWLKAPSLAIS